MTKIRSHGEGSVYKRKDGRWAGQVTIQGKHVIHYAKTQREAREWVRETLAQIQQGMTLASARTTLEQYLVQWLSTKQSSIRPKTFTQYRQIVKNHILPDIGRIKLKDVRPDQIQALYNRKLQSGVSTRSVLLIHGVLHHALNQAMKWGLIGRNPCDAVTRPRMQRKEMRTLDDNQVRSLLLATRGTRWEALFQLAITTGLREGEIIGLKWGDLDWKTRHLHVQRQVQRQPEGQVEFTEPKSASSRRVISLGVATVEKLREHDRIIQLERQAAGDRWQENDLIFPSTIGSPLDCRNLLRVFKEYLKEAGLPELRFHDLRHTSASLMLAQGIHPKVVQERLGHSQISLTLATYSHVLPVLQDEAAQKMDELITPIDVTDKVKGIKEKIRIYDESTGL